MQVFINGLISGLAIALLGLAFALVYLPTGVFHIALGAIYPTVSFVAWSCVNAGTPWPLAAFAAVVVGAALSVGCEVVNHARLARLNATPASHLVSSLGIYIVIVQVIVLIWGNEAQVLHEGPHRVIKVLNCSFTLGQVLTATVAVVFLSIGYVWLRFSNLGLQFRALADSPVEFALRGHNVQIIRIVAFALSGVFGTAAALLTAYDMGFNPHEGLSILLLAIVAVLIGGRGSFLGPVLGGILVGILRAGTIWFLSARWQEAATFIILVLFLYLRPHGLLAKKYRMEVEA